MIKKLLCLIGIHVWRVSWLQPLNLLRGEYSVVCDRCHKVEIHQNGRKS